MAIGQSGIWSKMKKGWVWRHHQVAKHSLVTTLVPGSEKGEGVSKTTPVPGAQISENGVSPHHEYANPITQTPVAPCHECPWAHRATRWEDRRLLMGLAAESLRMSETQEFVCQK